MLVSVLALLYVPLTPWILSAGDCFVTLLFFSMLVLLNKFDALIVVLCSPHLTAVKSTSERLMDFVVVTLSVQPKDPAGNEVAVFVEEAGLDIIL